MGKHLPPSEIMKPDALARVRLQSPSEMRKGESIVTLRLAPAHDGPDVDEGSCAVCGVWLSAVLGDDIGLRRCTRHPEAADLKVAADGCEFDPAHMHHSHDEGDK